MAQDAALTWHVSSACNQTDCVAVAMGPDGQVWVRHTSSADVVLRFGQQEWAAFLAGVRNSEFDVG